MRIVLANTPLTLGPKFPIPSIIRDKGKDIPLGLLYLASSLQKAGFDDVHVVDSHSLGLSPDGTAKKISSLSPDFVGISVTSFSIKDLYFLAKGIRENNPKCHICLGGHHPTIYPDITVQNDWCDSVCVGFGEKTIIETAGRLQSGLSLENIPGLKYKDGSGQITGPAVPEKTGDIDRLPFPARSLIKKENYKSWVVDRPAVTTAMITSRGCPFGCVFCSMAKTPFVQRSVKNVLEEVEQCVAGGFQMINFEDDSMNLDRKWFMEFCDGMAGIEHGPAWGFRGRVANFDTKTALVCSKAGCERINFGVESGSKEILDRIGKGVTLEQVKEAISAAKNAGIMTVAYFIMGFPKERENDLGKTYHFARKMNPDFAQFTPLVLLPGTALYKKQLLDKGRDPFAQATKNPEADFFPPKPKGMLARKVVHQWVRKSYLKFYFSPKFLFSKKGFSGGLFRGIIAGKSLLYYILFGPKNWGEKR